MSLRPELLEELVAAVADELAARLGAFSAVVAPSAGAEPWSLLSLAEVAERLGRSERWVRERVRRGELARVRLDGGALAFELEDVRAFAQARRVAVEESAALAERPLRAVSRGWVER